MPDDEFYEGLWIYGGPPPEEPEPKGPGCLAILVLLAVGYGIIASGLWAPVLVAVVGEAEKIE